MDKSKLTQYNTEFQRLMVERYAGDIPESGPNSYEKVSDFLFILNAAEQYEVEPKMLAYAKEHSDATVRELHEYFHFLVPDGLPPCASEWDDDEDYE